MKRVALHTPLLFISIKILASSTFTAVIVHSQQPPELQQPQLQPQQPQPDPATWKWDYNHYSPFLPLLPDDENDTSQPPYKRTRTLIIQSLPPGAEEELLKITSRVNRAYAKRWGFDYLSYVGQDPYSSLLTKVFQMGEVKNNDTSKYCKHVTHDGGDSVSDGDDEESDDCTTRDENDADANIASPPPATIPSVYTSPTVALRQYSTVMLLQSDAIIVDLDYNILDLIRDDQLVSCGMNQNFNTDEGLWDVYSDVIMWNLRHRLFYNVTQLWVESDENRVDGMDGVVSSSNSNESIVRDLVQVLMSVNVGVDKNKNTQNQNQENTSASKNAVAVVQEIPREMVSGLDGRVIKQARHSSKIQSITNHDLKMMIPVIQGISDTVCYRYYPQCEIVYY
mmetsp:Transcript_26913/g.39849  ORF Transcript_26913/g.39849 Transcript_26913/m.39849 type:complete len:395 (-) Transcript_26913:99-1283(-)